MMKKYLMTAMAAMTLSAAFTGCSHDSIETPTQAQIDKANYDAAFIKAFGKPAANQDWGFGTTTRTYNVEGNLWHDPAYYNLEYDAKVTTAEKNLVFNYVNRSTNVETVDQISFTEYWVAQIWNGNKDANADGVKAPTSTSYADQNGNTTTIVGGAQMDKLEILEAADTWTHCNNFNYADNTDYKEDGEGGRTLMTQSGTLSFRYTNSQGSFLSEKYIIVPGEKIDASLKGFYYVCFDFEKGYTDEEKAQEVSYGTCEKWVSQATEQNPDAGYWQSENWNLQGFYQDANSADLKNTLEANLGTQVRNITFKGYLYGDKHCDGDGNYTDWIVRISPAKVKGINYDLRVMAEDLSASQASDFDFNDVVFDAKIEGGKTYIKLLAAGGTLPLKIGCDENGEGGEEVHDLFGEKTTVMVNTYAGAHDAYDYVEFVLDQAYSSIGEIPVYVFKNNTWQQITAYTGMPASKFGCPVGTDWADERQDIDEKWNGGFTIWVGDTQKPFWADWNTAAAE